MALSRSSVYLLSCLVLLALVVPTLAVNRLFVDKLSGYHQELVSAEDVDSDLVRTTLMIVETGVDINSLDDHVINTVGSIRLDGTELDFTATDSIDISSFGGNVRFAADTVSVSADQGGVVSSTEATVHADTLSLTYDTFDVDGADPTIRSLGDIDFNGTSLNMDAADTVGMIASTIDMSFGGAFSSSSGQSNLRVTAGKAASFSASQSMTITGQSGVDVISFHDELALASTLGDASFSGENAEIRGLHTIGLVAAGDTTYSAQTIETASDSVQFVAGDDLAFTSDGSVMLAANGHALVAGADLNANAVNINVNSASDLVFISGVGNMDLLAGADFSGSGDLVHVHAGDDLAVSSGAALLVSSGYELNIDSSEDDVIFTASTAGLTLTATEMASIYSAEGTFTLQSDDLAVNFEDEARFAAENNLSFFSDGSISFASNDDFEVLSHNGVQFQSAQDLTLVGNTESNFGSSRHFFVNSATDTSFSGAFDLTAFSNYVATANSMDFSATNNLNVVSEGDVVLDASGTVTVDSAASDYAGRFVVFGANTGDIDFISQDMNLETRIKLELSAGNNVAITGAGDLTISTALLDFSGEATGVTVEAGSNFDISGSGGQLYSSTSGNTLETDIMQLSGSDVFSVFQETDVDATSIQFSGSWTFEAATARDGTVFLDGDDLDFQMDDDFDFFGGSITIDIETFAWDSGFLFLESGNGQDTTIDGASELDINGGDLIASMPYISFNADDLTLTVASDAQFTASEGTISVSTATSTALDGQNISVTADNTFSTGLMSGTEGVSFQVIGDMAQAFGASFVQTASGSITYTATEDLSMNFVDDATTTITSRTLGTYESLGGPTSILSDEDQVYDGVDTDVTVTVDMIANGDEVNYISRGLVRFDTGTAFEAFVVGNHNVIGGDIVIEAGTDIIYNVDSLSFGGVPPTEENPSDGTVTVESGDETIFSFGGLAEMFASGNNPYIDEAITMMAEAGTVNFLANNAVNGLEFNGNNGVNITTTTSAVTSHQGVLFHARTGSFIGESSSIAPIGLTLASVGHDAVTQSFSTRVQADLASVVVHASDDVDFTAGFFQFSGAAGASFVNYDSGDMTTQANTATLTFNAGGNFIASAGEGMDLDATDFVTTTGGDLFIHSLSTEDAIEFAGSSPASATAGTDIDVVGGFYAYPSGEHSVQAGTATVTTGTQDFGGIKFGSKTGSTEFDYTQDMTFTAGGHVSYLGGGVDGHVDFLAGGITTMTAGQNYIVDSAQSSIYNVDGSTTITAATDATFSSDSETEGISHVATDDITYTANLPAGATDGITVLSHYIVADVDGEYIFDALEWTVGENNQPHNPVFLANVGGWEQTSVGTAQYTVANNEFSMLSVETEITTGANVLLTSGGDQIYHTTWATGVVGDGLLELTSANGQVAFVADNTIEAETSTGEFSATTIAIQTQGNSPSSNVVMQSKCNIEFVGDVEMDVQTNAHFVTGAVDFRADDITVSSSAGTFDISSDHDASVSSTGGDFVGVTQANNAHIEVQTLGENSDITVASLTGDVVLTSASDAEFIGDSTLVAGSSSLTLEATSANNGKIQMQGSGEVRVAGAGSSFNSADDLYLDAIGEDSTFRVEVGDVLNTAATEELHFDNNPGEGGSIIFRFENAPLVTDGSAIATIGGDSWNVDIDGDFLVQTVGDFAFSTNDEFDITIGGYTDLHTEEGSVETQNADLVVESNAASIRFLSGGEFDVGTTGSLDIVAEDGFTSNVRGNRTSNELLFIIDDISIDSENSVTVAAYDSLIAFSDNYMNFRAVNSIDMLTDFPGGDITFFAPRMEIDAEHIVVNVTAGAGAASTQTRAAANQNARDTSGKLKIDNNQPFSYYDAYYEGVVYWNYYESAGVNPPPEVAEPTVSAEKEAFMSRMRSSVPGDLAERGYWEYGADFASNSLNIFKGAEQLSVSADQGDLRFEYAEDLLLASDQITGVSSGGIEIHAYGEGRRTTPENYFYSPLSAAIIFADLSALNFRTNNVGSGEISVESAAGSIYAFSSSTTSLRAGNDNLYLSSRGTLAIVNVREDAGIETSGEVDFTSVGDVNIRAYDDDVNVFGFSVSFASLANDDLTFHTSNGLAGVVDIQTEAVTGTYAGDVNFSSSVGDIYLLSECVLCSTTDVEFNADTINVNHANDAYFEYSDQLTLRAGSITLDALPQDSTYGAHGVAHSGAVRFDGRTADYHVGSDQAETFRPTVFFSDQLALTFDTSANPTGSSALPGGYCEFDRSISIDDGEGLFGRESLCICIDHTWQCRREAGSSGDIYYWAPNPYDPTTYTPYG
mmetsp:Transcript_19757/g.75744  ORF Transcript_19757/g.75744 Transcript_19757/m.75744 type:complete len:2306 (+) Transcript_19757:106-7023(+)